MAAQLLFQPGHGVAPATRLVNSDLLSGPTRTVQRRQVVQQHKLAKCTKQRPLRPPPAARVRAVYSMTEPQSIETGADEARHAAGEPQSKSTSASASRQRLFNRISPMYDQLNDWLSLGQHRVWKRMTVKWSGARVGDTVLDVCCGSGDVSLLLAERVGPSGKVVGLDFAADLLAVAKERQNASYGASRVDIKWVEGDALSLPFGAENFDAATISYGLRNVTDIPRCLGEIYRVLRPGACVAVLDFNRATGPAGAGFQGWMLDNVVVPVARQFDMEEEYEYLRPSIERFPTGPEQVDLAREAGFSHATHYDIAGGLMGVLVARK